MRTVFASFIVMCVLGAGGAASAQGGDDPALLKLYKSQCSTCHGLDGKGQTTSGKANGVKDWTDHKTITSLSDEKIVAQIRAGKKDKDGKELMPAFTKLTEDQVKALVGYVRKLAK